MATAGGAGTRRRQQRPGRMVCDCLHRGLRPEDETSRCFPATGMPQVLVAAQSELCPATLHQSGRQDP